MNSSNQNWYFGWEKAFTPNQLDTLHIPSALNIMDFFGEFLERQSINTCYEVLNAPPGHGKTTALKIFIKKMIQDNNSVGGLIVLREKAQMRGINEFVSGHKNGALYIDSDNYHEVKDQISHYQFVIISHERFKRMALDKRSTKFGNYEKWGDIQRLIIIDEAPPFVDSAVFELGKNMDWLDDCFRAGKHLFSSAEIIKIRSIIQIIMAEEFLENKGRVTRALKHHLDSQRFAEVLERFFKNVDSHMEKVISAEGWGIYTWFKRLYNEDNVGFIDSGIYLDSYSDHKKIICSQRIDYHQLGGSILILDGTAIYTKTMYNNEYTITALPNFTKYERLILYQRCINTSARQRKRKVASSTQKLITEDIQEIQKVGISPFPIMNKFEIPIYYKLNAISKEDYQRYFQLDIEENRLPINLLNTIGKNQLANQKSLYLTSLPNKSAVFYKEMAISLYKDSEESLVLSMSQKDKEHSTMWFADQRIEKIYLECLLSELYQIIHRSNIRNLLVPSSEKVHVFIATKFDYIIDKLIDMFNRQVKCERYQIERLSKFQLRISVKVMELSIKIKKENIKLPNRIGKIENGSSIKNLINQSWKDEQKKREIISAFHRHNLDIKEKVNGSGKVWKEIDNLKKVFQAE